MKAAALDDELTKAETEFEAQAAEFKKVKAAHKSNAKNLSDQRKKLNREVQTKTATITDKAVLHLNHDMGSAEYWYDFPGEGWKSFDSRPLEDAERQGSLLKEQAEAMPESGQEIEEDE